MTSTPLPALLIGLALAGCSGKDGDAVSLTPTTAAPPGAAALDAHRDAGTAATATAPEPAPGSVPYTGTVEAHRRSTLTPKIPSTAVKVHVREGDRVRAGDPLVTFDLKDVKLRLRQARAALEGAKIQREAALDEWRRVKALADSQAVPRAQFEGVEFKKRGADVGVTGAQVAVEMGEKAVRDSIVRAPYDCVIVHRLVNEGDYAMTMPPTPLFVVEETDTLDLRVRVPSSEMGRIREGDPVAVRFPSLGRTIEAAVTRTVASIDPHTRTFSVIVEIPNSEGALLPGLFAEARFGSAAAAEATP
jgi:RND family efflux transporter MFP subunit